VPAWELLPPVPRRGLFAQRPGTLIRSTHSTPHLPRFVRFLGLRRTQVLAHAPYHPQARQPSDDATGTPPHGTPHRRSAPGSADPPTALRTPRTHGPSPNLRPIRSPVSPSVPYFRIAAASSNGCSAPTDPPAEPNPPNQPPAGCPTERSPTRPPGPVTCASRPCPESGSHQSTPTGTARADSCPATPDRRRQLHHAGLKHRPGMPHASARSSATVGDPTTTRQPRNARRAPAAQSTDPQHRTRGPSRCQPDRALAAHSHTGPR